ncbi:MAG: transporter substrate-binding domain-containing protein [Clostridia bacterium]|nr:transporter substrate-binding domain-containing protein [Clostridia bacterium]MBR3553067.1 transporter substrate-binding domain-containing protein [Clostridia bacterium]
MKKILAIVLACLLVLCCFAGCKKDKEEAAGKLVILEEPLTTEPYAFVTKLGNDTLIQAIDAELAKLVADGTVKSIFEKYNAPYIAPEETPAAAKEATDDSLQKVLDAGKLTIATSPDFPPFENLEDGKIVGIEVDLMNIICEKLGVALEIQSMDFDAILPGLATGKYDLGVAGFTASEERKENALFTASYCLAAISIVVPEGSDIKSKADLEGKKLSCQSGTTAELYCQTNGYDCDSFAQNTDAQMALTTGKVDAWVIDNLTAIEMVNAFNNGTAVADAADDAADDAAAEVDAAAAEAVDDVTA